LISNPHHITPISKRPNPRGEPEARSQVPF
jgi:hypothetical protein